MNAEKVKAKLRGAHTIDILERYFFTAYMDRKIDDAVFDDVLSETDMPRDEGEFEELQEELRKEFNKIAEEFYKANEL